ncbi:MAG: 5'-nucleotidase C-terminal domain-containing protein [Acidaminobacteraceae bacterium]
MKTKKIISSFLVMLMIFSSLSVGAFADTYNIKSGDMLWKIAKELDTDYMSLAKYNNIKNPNMIYAGDTLNYEKKGNGKLTLLHTNDMHGFFIEGKYDGMGAAKMATFIKNTRKSNPNTLLLDAGDALQGHNLVTLSDGEEGTKVLNALGYDAMTSGNHEYDYGQAQTVKLKEMLNFPMLASNVKKADGSLLLDDTKIFELMGFKVGVFGLTTPETTYKSHPDNTIGLVFDDIYATSEAKVKELKAGGADVIVALAHIGDEGEFTTAILANKVAGIDVIIDGHSHSTYETGNVVGDTLIVSAGEKTKNVGVVEITIKNGMVATKEAKLFTKTAAAELEDDANMAAIVETIKSKNDIITEEVVANSPVLLMGEKSEVRTKETNLGNLLTESLLDISKADVAFTNGGGIRSSIPAGQVTKGDILTVLPFGNTVRVIELKGSDIWAAIENGVDEYPEAKGAFPHIAGMTVKFDSTLEAGKKVTEIKVAGEMIDLEKTYTMATNDFLVAGGDGYTMFEGKKVVAEFGAMDEVLIDFIKANGFGKAVEDKRIMDINEMVSFIFELFAA